MKKLPPVSPKAAHSLLVVDDDFALLLQMRQRLEDLGFDVDCVADGLAAVKQFELKNYCLVFMDIHMPNVSGLHAVAAIRTYELQQGRATVPIIATVSKGPSRELCLAVGMNDYLQKPLDLCVLTSVVEKWNCKTDHDCSG